MIIVWILGAIAANAIVGAAVLAAVDRRGDLLDWYREAPNEWFKLAVVELWPLVAFLLHLRKVA